MKTVTEKQVVFGKKFLAEFEKSFYFDHVKSQKLASIILSFLLLLLGSLWFSASFILQKQINEILHFNFPARALGLILLSLSLYEGLYAFFLNYCIQKERKISGLIKYFHAAVEIFLLTVLLSLLARHFPNPILFFCSPGILVYFVFIILSTLRLSFRLGLFTGILCGAANLFLFIDVYPKGPIAEEYSFLYAIFPQIIKSIIMVIAGAIAGFVAHQLNLRIYSSLQNLSNKNYITSLFGQYISPAIADKLIHQHVDLSPELRQVCVMFLDIRDFTSYAETKTPKEVIEFLNHFFIPLIDIINKNHGIINKFLGDGFMAVFGAPVSDGQDVQNAVRAAFEILEEVKKMNELKELRDLRCGMGLHSGPAMTGNIGSEDRKEYTVIGDTVNLASRVEQLNKKYNSQLVVTQSVYEVIKNDHPALSTDLTEIKGKKNSIEIYVLA